MPNPTTLEERLQIIEWSKAGLTDQQIADEIERSIETVRKWRRRGTRLGRQALSPEMGRPKEGALSSFPQALRERLLSWRKAHPGWAPKTLLAELESRSDFVVLPSRSSIARFLEEMDLITRPYEKHSELPALAPPRNAKAPHQLWEMDARGNEKIEGVGTIALVDLNDRYSRARLLSYPCPLEKAQSHPTTEDYKTLLRLAFSGWGLPERIQVDHESVFFDNQSKSPYPSRLHLWLCSLGVELCFTRAHRPTDQAMTERSHQLWYKQVVQGRAFASWSELYEASVGRRDFLNYELPCASLRERPPLVAFPQARHSGRFYHPLSEGELVEVGRVDALLKKGKWFRRASKDLTVCLGGFVYYAKGARKGEQLEIGYDSESRELLFTNESGESIGRKAIKGVSVKELLGEFEAYVGPLSFQMELPLRWTNQGVARLCETMAV